ncbi:MAG: endopeptidase La [Desulfofustis sp.]
MFFKKRSAKPESPQEPTTLVPPAAEDLGPLALLHQKIVKTDLPEEVAEQAESELKKLEKTDSVSAEYTIGINYIETLISIPWFALSTDNLDIERAEKMFSRHHYGLDEIKDRILDFLAAKALRSFAKPRMLIVDDESIAQENLRHYFTKQGLEVMTADNGKDALEIIAHHASFDIILTDLKMDQMDGLELLDHLSSISPDTRVIMITGYATVPSAVDALHRGATHYLAKPVDLDELRASVNEVLQHNKRLDLTKGPVLCFTGPPGTGKTSIGHNVARAIGREFVRISMGGLKDEAELRGHRRTYVGAMPGRIVNEIRRCGVMNPCIMLDEIDKIGQDFRGDPAAVLLEVLDPEQNASFIDHYLEVPIDLSKVMFITTANEPEKLPQPLLDRMEILEFSGYSVKEKTIIAQNYLIPEQLSDNGLLEATPTFSDKVLEAIINNYTQEAGIRGLNREIGKICRKLARIALQQRSSDRAMELPVDESDIVSFLGPPRYRKEAAEGADTVGVVTALVWTKYGGEIMFVETRMMPGKSQLILTGSMGDILQESAQTALSYIRSNTDRLKIESDFFERLDLHIHLPAGAVSKDGPSAGAAICLALISLLTGRLVRRTVAITGELSLTGQILPVGGIREKFLAAARAGVTKLLIPEKNSEEVECLPEDTRQQFTIIPITQLDEAIDHLLHPFSDHVTAG